LSQEKAEGAPRRDGQELGGQEEGEQRGEQLGKDI
jgi:hypothetical protein